MTRTLLLLLVAATLVAGCAATDNGTPTPTPTGGGSAGGATNATATKIKTDTHDFSTDAAAGTPAGGSTTTALAIPAGITTLNLTVKFDPAGGAPAGLTNGITVKVGAITCSLPAGPVTASSTCTQKGVATGVKQIEYSGAGPVVATVTVSGS